MELKDLSPQEMQLIIAALGELPIRVGAVLYNKVQTQFAAQSAPLSENNR